MWSYLLFQNSYPSGHVRSSYKTCLEEKYDGNIHTRLVSVYGKAALYLSIIRRWFNRVNGNPRELNGNKVK